MMAATGLFSGTQAIVLQKSVKNPAIPKRKQRLFLTCVYASGDSRLDLVNKASNSPIAEKTVTKM